MSATGVAGDRPGTGLRDVSRARVDFPILRRLVRGKPLAYLDNAATTQKPQCVIDATTRYYTEENANIHRGVHLLSEQATRAYEAARDSVRDLLNAPESRNIVFVRGCTEAINMVAQSYGRAFLAAGDEVIVSALEHHSNIVPWQMLREQTGIVLRVIPINDAGELLMEEYERLLGPRTRIVAVNHVSNALGTINPVKRIVELARAAGAITVIDGAQSVSHMPVDVQDIGCDFYAISAHKVFGPTGIGALYGRAEALDRMPPWQGGGDMIETVSFEGSTWARVPARFEAGTPNIAGSIGFGVACDYVMDVGLDGIARYEADLLAYATPRVSEVPGLRVVGTAREKAGVLSFVMDCAHPHDIGTILDGEGVAVRTGHHCCQPLMQRLGVPATARASLAFYNTRDDVDALVDALARVREVLG